MKTGFLILCCLLMFSASGFGKDLDEENEELTQYAEFSDAELVERPSDIDIEEYHSFPLWDRMFYMAGEIQFASKFMGDYELRDVSEDDLLEIEPAVSFELFYPATNCCSFFLEAEVQYLNEFRTEKGEHYRKWIVERTESWIF